MPPRPLGVSRVLVCFAVPQEARYFAPETTWPNSVVTSVTGMGRRNALDALAASVQIERPVHVFTCGVAGGLNPDIRAGTPLFSEDTRGNLRDLLQQSGAIPATFHCASRVAVTAAEKSQLWQQTGADAVEMESGAIREWCRENGIKSTTLRVISDAAHEELPLDFNALFTPDFSINFHKLALTLIRSPWKIPALIRLQRRTVSASRILAYCLRELFATHPLS